MVIFTALSNCFFVFLFVRSAAAGTAACAGGPDGCTLFKLCCLLCLCCCLLFGAQLGYLVS